MNLAPVSKEELEIDLRRDCLKEARSMLTLGHVEKGTDPIDLAERVHDFLTGARFTPLAAGRAFG